MFKITPKILLALILISLSSVGNAEKEFAAPGVHRMVEVVYLADRSEITDGPGRWAYDRLIAQGVRDSDIVDGSFAIGRIYCCKRDPADDFTLKFYASADLGIEVGDIVEIRLGVASQDNSGEQPILSVAVRKRERANDPDSACWWDPDQPGLWMKVIRCRWMESEGWVYQKGMHKTWYRPGEFNVEDFASPPLHLAVEAQNAETRYPEPSLADLPFAEKSVTVRSSTRLDSPALHVAVADDAVWVLNGDGVSRFDPSSGSVTQEIKVGSADRLLGYTQGSIWVGSDTTKRADRYDATTGEQQESIRFKYTPALIREAAGSLWISTIDKGRLFRLDPETLKVTKTIKTGKSGGAIISAFDSLWVTDGHMQVVRVDPTTGNVTGKIRNCYGATMLLALERSIWVACTGSGEIAEIDPGTMMYRGRVRVGGYPFELAGSDNRLWYRDVDGRSVNEIDKATQQARKILLTQSRAFGLVHAFGSLWITDVDSGYLFRIDIDGMPSE